jgi:hypothetical protein
MLAWDDLHSIGLGELLAYAGDPTLLLKLDMAVSALVLNRRVGPLRCEWAAPPA